MTRTILGAVVALLLLTQPALGFDHSHGRFAGVLATHVQWQPGGHNSRVDYAALRAEPAELAAYLTELSAVTAPEFGRWTEAEQLNPWKMHFFTLLGEPMYLDRIEHEIIREPGRYDEPRIHFAVNCASIGCPALRPEPFTADRESAIRRADGTELPVHMCVTSMYLARCGHAGLIPCPVCRRPGAGCRCPGKAGQWQAEGPLPRL